MLVASPMSCIASEMIAILPVYKPPINSKIEKARFNKNAIRILRSVFIISPIDVFESLLYNQSVTEQSVQAYSIHRTVNMQSLNHRLSGRAFHTIKSYLKHSDLKRIIIRNPSLLIQAFSAIEADVRLVYAGYALIFVHRLP